MHKFIAESSPVVLTLAATIYTWGMTALGAALVYFFNTASKKMMDAMLGFAAGIMTAASFFSLILPAIEHADANNLNSPFIATIGFLAGCVFLFLTDKLIPHLHESDGDIHGRQNIKLGKSTLLVIAIILHNIPEGLAIGITIGALSKIPGADLISALPLVIGMGIQNFPEGAAVSLPARQSGYSKHKAFFLGQFSGFVEPVSALIGLLLASALNSMLPFAMTFAAGAMIYVVFDEIIPSAHEEGKQRLTTVMAILGFAAMMYLDLSFS